MFSLENAYYWMWYLLPTKNNFINASRTIHNSKHCPRERLLTILHPETGKSLNRWTVAPWNTAIP